MVARQLKSQFECPSLLGLAYDRALLQREDQLRVIMPDEVNPPVYRVGVYVPGNRIDDIVPLIQGIFDPLVAGSRGVPI